MSEFCAGVLSSARCARDSCSLRRLAAEGVHGAARWSARMEHH
ncbi:hypothetical protein A2U01_0076619 [Trifolium medium]|uniref:Uncharacterized protein n=1 Tax=Trifolium medium TaxID=97028 RepID=A0A392T2V4_9FABA|nr:hypothetical protein [Trifolium medium]